MASFRTFVASLLALALIVGAPVAAWAGAAAIADCTASASAGHQEGCCGEGSSTPGCGTVCASSFPAAVGKGGDAHAADVAAVAPQRNLGQPGLILLPPDTAPPKRFSA